MTPQHAQTIPIDRRTLLGLIEYLDSRPHRESRRFIDALADRIQACDEALANKTKPEPTTKA